MLVFFFYSFLSGRTRRRTNKVAIRTESDQIQVTNLAAPFSSEPLHDQPMRISREQLLNRSSSPRRKQQNHNQTLPIKIDQSATTRRDKPRALIPPDADQIDDPLVFARSFTASKPNSKSPNHAMNATWRRGKNSSKQRDDDQHASNLSLIILDSHKNLHATLLNLDTRRRRPRRDDTRRHNCLISI